MPVVPIVVTSSGGHFTDHQRIGSLQEVVTELLAEYGESVIVHSMQHVEVYDDRRE